MSKTRVMLVDDHVFLRAGVRSLLSRQADLEVVAEAGNVNDAVPLACRERPELLILDMKMPGGPSLALLKQLKEKGIATRVLVLSMHDDPAYARTAIAAGALGYVVKTISEQDLLAAIRSVKRGHLFINLDNDAKTASVFGDAALSTRIRSERPLEVLSERETEVLLLLGRGHSNQAVADLLSISPKTVATYKTRIGEKLGLKTTPEFVKFVTETGLIEKVE